MYNGRTREEVNRRRLENACTYPAGSGGPASHPHGQGRSGGQLWWRAAGAALCRQCSSARLRFALCAPLQLEGLWNCTGTYGGTAIIVE